MTSPATTDKLTYRLKLILFLGLIIAALYLAQGFLKPIFFAALLAMLLVPMTRKMEKKGLSTYIAAFVSILAVSVIIAAVGALLWWQTSELAQNTENIERTFDEWMRQSQRFAYRTFGLTRSDQEKILDEQQSAITSYIPTIMQEVVATTGKIALVLVYTYFFLTFRLSIKRFLLHVSPSSEERTKSIISSVNQVSIAYLSGLLKLIVVMTTLYSLGYWAIGISNPIFFAGICGILEMIPFVGNLLGTLITCIGAIAQDGNTDVIPLIFVVYFIIQFIQSYILEPLIVGGEVNLNPLFSIMALIAGEMLWGISGMILAIPVLGVIKIYLDHYDHLRPYGRLLGTESQESSIGKKVKEWLERFKR